MYKVYCVLDLECSIDATKPPNKEDILTASLTKTIDMLIPPFIGMKIDFEVVGDSAEESLAVEENIGNYTINHGLMTTTIYTVDDVTYVLQQDLIMVRLNGKYYDVNRYNLSVSRLVNCFGFRLDTV